MISHLSGTCIEKNEKNLTISVGGVGYLVFATLDTISTAEIGEEVSVWTHLAVRENSLEFFGFKEKEELNFFELLISISGIGPRGALGVMSVTNVDTLIKAIATGDTSYLTKVSGIGKKTAEKIVLELRDKLKTKDIEGSGNADLKEEADVLLALQSLGYSNHQARDAIKQIPKEILDTSKKVKEALKILGGK